MSTPSYEWAARLTLAERAAALRVGAAVLRERWPTVQSSCSIVIGPNVLDAQARFAWPGIVRVSLRWSGRLIAQSKPGDPFTLERHLKEYGQ